MLLFALEKSGAKLDDHVQGNHAISVTQIRLWDCMTGPVGIAGDVLTNPLASTVGGSPSSSSSSSSDSSGSSDSSSSSSSSGDTLCSSGVSISSFSTGSRDGDTMQQSPSQERLSFISSDLRPESTASL